MRDYKTILRTFLREDFDKNAAEERMTQFAKEGTKEWQEANPSKSVSFFRQRDKFFKPVAGESEHQSNQRWKLFNSARNKAIIDAKRNWRTEKESESRSAPLDTEDERGEDVRRTFEQEKTPLADINLYRRGVAGREADPRGTDKEEAAKREKYKAANETQREISRKRFLERREARLEAEALLTVSRENRKRNAIGMGGA